MSEIVGFTTDEKLEALLHTDGLANAEAITGKSYKEDDTTQSLGFLLHVANGDAKRDALLARGDTTFSNDLSRYTQIITDYGFRQVLDIPFSEKDGSDGHLFVYWHDDGLLLTFDTYSWTGRDEISVNGGEVLYSWRPSDDLGERRWRLTSSGSFNEDGVWSGGHDCREALIFNLEQLRAHGEFVSPWVGRHFLWLLHHMDTKDEGYDHKAITAERVAMLPPEVQEAISVGK